MGYINNDKYNRDFKNLQFRYGKGVIRYLNRYAIDVEVQRLIPEVKSTLDDYAAIVGKDKMLVNQKVKTVEKTKKFNMRLAVLNYSFYNINNPVYEDIEVIYSDNKLEVGDQITTTLGNRTIIYVIKETPKVYYDVLWQAILSPLSREQQ